MYKQATKHVRMITAVAIALLIAALGHVDTLAAQSSGDPRPESPQPAPGETYFLSPPDNGAAPL